MGRLMGWMECLIRTKFGGFDGISPTAFLYQQEWNASKINCQKRETKKAHDYD